MDFTYPDSKSSRLVERYFPGPTYNVNKGRLVDRFIMGGWDNTNDPLLIAILYFIHPFVFSQLGDATIPIEDFLMVEDGNYQQFPWGQLVFTKLMKSFRKEYKPDKQMYRLNGFPYAPNIWIAIKEGNCIPRICNWKVVAAKPKFEMFMETIFTENDCSNIQPTPEEIRSLDLPDTVMYLQLNQIHQMLIMRRCNQRRIYTTPKRRKVAHLPKTNVLKATQPDEQPNQPFQTPNSQLPQADNVSVVPHDLVFQRIDWECAGLEEDYMKCYVDNKIGALKALIKENHFELMKTVGAKDNKIRGISMPHIVDDSVEKGNVDPQPTSDKFFQQPISPIRMDFATVDHDINVPIVEVEQQHGTDAKDAKVLPITHHSDFSKNEILRDKEMEDATVEATELDSIERQLPTQLLVKEPAHNLDTKTPAPRNIISSKIMQSPYLTSFESSDKGKEKIDDDIRPYTLHSMIFASHINSRHF
ncbi:hypothetical protein H5410_057522 [Solanum commersonii]|uniref:DUF1985 domain-containing protein n=1 Tax=Solanum commersonii TaxID=4109 RepID=A0A9J5WQF2_SOLCO|nr:hypothetical protein H5410_057522 [Solanum commersonii]